MRSFAKNSDSFKDLFPAGFDDAFCFVPVFIAQPIYLVGIFWVSQGNLSRIICKSKCFKIHEVPSRHFDTPLSRSAAEIMRSPGKSSYSSQTNAFLRLPRNDRPFQTPRKRIGNSYMNVAYFCKNFTNDEGNSSAWSETPRLRAV